MGKTLEPVHRISIGRIISITTTSSSRYGECKKIDVLWCNGNINTWIEPYIPFRKATQAEITLYWPSTDPKPNVIRRY